MNKIIFSVISFSTLLMAAITPADAQAFKIKLEPSVTFRQSRERVYRPRPITHTNVYSYSAPTYTYYQPYTGSYYTYYEPVQTYQYVDYYYPSYRPSRSYGTDFQMKFKLK